MDRNTDTKDTIRECGLTDQAIAWVQEYGSEYLRSCVEKGDFCRHKYNQERAQLETPGWSLLYEVTYQPDHPPAETMDLLARAREQFPQARLWQVDGDDEGCVEYVAVAEAPWPSGGIRLIFDDRIRVYKD